MLTRTTVVPGSDVRLDVDDNSGQLVLREALGPGDGITPSVLGLFLDGERWDGASSIQASIDRGSVERTRLRRVGGIGFDVPIERGSTGWRCPIEYPRAAVFGNTGDLLLLGSDGQSLSHWTPKGGDAWAWTGASPLSGEAGVAMWRDGETVFLGLGPSSSPKTLGVRDGRWGVVGTSVDGQQDLVEVMPGAFVFGAPAR